MKKTYGIHHVSSIVGHAQKNIDYYAGVLGMKLVKKTLNYDDMKNYHFYFGNQDGSTGLTTTFPRLDAEEGVIGSGQVGYVTHAVRPGTLDFWEERLKQFGFNPFRYTRFNQTRLAFQDPDLLELEFVESDLGPDNTWSFNGVQPQQAPVGLYSATLLSKFPEDTRELLVDIFGYTVVDEDDEIVRLKVNDELGGYIELNKKYMPNGKGGIGTVHHIALKVRDEDIEEWVTILKKEGYHPTEVKDRQYFKSVYFRDMGNILFELATMGPGVLVDESLDTLGLQLQIPPHFKDTFNHDTSTLMPVFLKPVEALKNYGYRNALEYTVTIKREQLLKDIDVYSKILKDRPLTDEETQTLTALRIAFVNAHKEIDHE